MSNIEGGRLDTIVVYMLYFFKGRGNDSVDASKLGTWLYFPSLKKMHKKRREVQFVTPIFFHKKDYGIGRYSIVSTEVAAEEFVLYASQFHHVFVWIWLNFLISWLFIPSSFSIIFFDLEEFFHTRDQARYILVLCHNSVWFVCVFKGSHFLR